MGVVLLLPWVSGETVLVQWGPIALRWEGVEAALLIVSRFVSILTLGLLLLATSPILQTLQALRRLGLPRILADMMLLSYRYLQELEGMVETMGRAMVLRGYGRGQRSIGKPGPRSGLERWWRSVMQLAALLGTLLLRSYEQSERVYQAMVLRGYGTPLAYGGSGTGPSTTATGSTAHDCITQSTRPGSTKTGAARAGFKADLSADIKKVKARADLNSDTRAEVRAEVRTDAETNARTDARTDTWTHARTAPRARSAAGEGETADMRSIDDGFGQGLRQRLGQAIGRSGRVLTPDALPPDPARLSLSLALARAQPRQLPPVVTDFGGLVSTLVLALVFGIAAQL